MRRKAINQKTESRTTFRNGVEYKTFLMKADRKVPVKRYRTSTYSYMLKLDTIFNRV